MLLVGFSEVSSAQNWSIEPMLGNRFDWNQVREMQGDIQTEPYALFSFGVEVNRRPHPKLQQGIGLASYGFGNSFILEDRLTNALKLGFVNEFYRAVSFHQTYQFIKIQRFEFEGGVGGQLFFTSRLSGQSSRLDITTGLPGWEEQYSGKAGISPVGFVRANMRYRQKPTAKITSCMRMQLNVGTRPLYTTNVRYRINNYENYEGSGTVKNRGTGILFAFCLNYEFGKLGTVR